MKGERPSRHETPRDAQCKHCRREETIVERPEGDVYDRSVTYNICYLLSASRPRHPQLWRSGWFGPGLLGHPVSKHPFKRLSPIAPPPTADIRRSFIHGLPDLQHRPRSPRLPGFAQNTPVKTIAEWGGPGPSTIKVSNYLVGPQLDEALAAYGKSFFFSRIPPFSYAFLKQRTRSFYHLRPPLHPNGIPCPSTHLPRFTPLFLQTHLSNVLRTFQRYWVLHP